MKLEKLFLPLAVFAAVLTVYIFFRKSGGSEQANVPNPASSGVTLPYTQSGAVQPVSYNVPAINPAPSPLVLLQQPQNAFPQSPASNNGVPPYLTFNFGPSHDLSKQSPSSSPNPLPLGMPDECGCNSGCGATCGLTGAYPDGAGNVQMSSSRSRQINDDPNWITMASNNVLSYLALTGSAPIPNLQSTPPPSPVQSGTTNGTPYLTQ